MRCDGYQARCSPVLSNPPGASELNGVDCDLPPKGTFDVGLVSDFWAPVIRCNYIDASDVSRLQQDSGDGSRRVMASEEEEPEHSYWVPESGDDLPSPRPLLNQTEQWFLDMMVNETSPINITEALLEDAKVAGTS